MIYLISAGTYFKHSITRYCSLCILICFSFWSSRNYVEFYPRRCKCCRLIVRFIILVNACKLRDLISLHQPVPLGILHYLPYNIHITSINIFLIPCTLCHQYRYCIYLFPILYQFIDIDVSKLYITITITIVCICINIINVGIGIRR
jgi:hypothetical protein